MLLGLDRQRWIETAFQTLKCCRDYLLARRAGMRQDPHAGRGTER